MVVYATGSATDMHHQFTHPARVVEIDRRDKDDDEPEADDFLAPVPVATDDGTPVGRVRREETEPR
jgi:hypothetical protein